MTTTAQVTYRRTKNGEWVAYGPADIVRVGSLLVTKRDGTSKLEIVVKVGRPFTASGVAMVYGHLDRTAPTRRAVRNPWAIHRDKAGRCTCHGMLACLDD